MIRAAIVGIGRWGRTLVGGVQGKSGAIRFTAGHNRTRGNAEAFCAEHGIPCWVGGMLETAVGGAICAELATLPNFTYAGDIFPSSYFYVDDLGQPALQLSGPGQVATSRVPGIAQEPDPDLLARWTVAHAGFRV